VLHLIQAGQPSNPPILFLHGFLGSSNDWHSTITNLQHDWHCLALDLPGHGKSSSIETSFDRIPKQIIEALDTHSIERVHLIGYSMGGRVALATALEFPSRFKSLVLESASPGLRTKEERVERIAYDRLLAEQLKSFPFEAFLRQWYSQPLFETFQADISERLENNPVSLARALVDLSAGKQPSFWGKLSEWPIPCLVLTGEADQKYSKIAREMADLSNRIETVMVSGSGHVVHHENPGAFIDRIKQFLTEQDR